LFKDLSKNIEVAREEKVKSLETSWYGELQGMMEMTTRLK
jgi:hypothetical protein